MATIISFIVQWVILPIIMLAFLIFSFIIAKALKDAENKVSAQAGLWAGFLLCIVYVTIKLSVLSYPEFAFDIMPGLMVVPMLIGCGGGFLFLLMFRAIINTRLSGLLTLILSLGSLSGLFTYLFVLDLRPQVLYSVLGFTLGFLFHIVIFPSSVRALVYFENDQKK
jgi:hypothetical protein